MLYALLVLMVSTFNLLLGFMAAVRLGWGPSDLTQLWAGFSRSEQADEYDAPEYGSEVDLHRLIDFGDQRLRRLKNAKVEAHDPLQKGLYALQTGIDRTLLAIETAEARLMAAQFAPPASGWAALALALRTDVLEGYEQIETAIESSNQALGARDQHRLLNTRTALAASLRASRPQWHAWNPEAEEVAPESIEELLENIRTIHDDLQSLAAPLLGILHDMLGENQPVMEWDPSLHRHPGHGMQTVLALDADRRINPSHETPYFVSRVSIDQDKLWRHVTGRLLFHAVGDRFAERLGQHLPAHWMVVPLGGGEFLVRGESKAVDEFTADLDRLRQRIGATEVRIGSLRFHVTVSGVVMTDQGTSPTEFQLEELRRLLLIVQEFGGNRIFICDGGTEVPVMPLTEEFEAAVLEL